MKIPDEYVKFGEINNHISESNKKSLVEKFHKQYQNYNLKKITQKNQSV